MRGNDVPVVAYFFFRLPEILNMTSGPHFLDIDGPISGGGAVRSVLERPNPGTRVVTLVVHQVAAASIDPLDLEVVTELLVKAVPWALPRRRSSPWRHLQLRRGVRASNISATIIEAAVSLERSFDINADPSRPNAELTRGLDDILEAVNALQLLHYAVSRRPKSRVSAETLPGLIPFVLGQQSSNYMVPVRRGVSLFVNDLGQAAHDKRYDVSGEEPVSTATAFVARGPFTKYLELRMEAQSLLELRGEYRAALLMLAAATESLLDTTLMLMHWESGLSPDDAVQHFRPNVSVTRRVNTRFHTFLNDTQDDWNPWSETGPVANWNKRIAMVRNEVIHYGARVDRESAWRAWGVAEELRYFIGGKLAANYQSFPMTSLVFLTGLMMSFNYIPQDRIEEVLETRGRPHLSFFDRWIISVRELSLDHFNPRRPTWSSGGALMVISAHGDVAWVWHDWEHSKAQLIEPTSQQSDRSWGVDDVPDAGVHAFTIEGQPAAAMSDWMEEHWLVPGLECKYLGDEVEKYFGV